jgi:hypothetical protein
MFSHSVILVCDYGCPFYSGLRWCHPLFCYVIYQESQKENREQGDLLNWQGEEMDAAVLQVFNLPIFSLYWALCFKSDSSV